MYHSVTFGSKNSYSDWGLIPDGRPFIAMPQTKTNFIEIPGVSTQLDASEILTGYPVYGNRTGTIKFIVLNNVFGLGESHSSWVEKHEEISNYLHGKRVSMMLEDDPNYYYEGRFSVEWDTPNSNAPSRVNIAYELDPYKYYKNETIANKSSQSAGLYLTFNDGSLGQMPSIPSIKVSNIGSGGIDISLTNQELNINNEIKHISLNGTYKFYDVILSNISGTNTCRLSLTGNGKAEVKYRKGVL